MSGFSVYSWYAGFVTLWQANWTMLAEILLRNYTREVYLATTNHGWDGHLDQVRSSDTHLDSSSHLYDDDDVDDDDQYEVALQWDLSGSLLFAVTVITTIGRPQSVCSK